MGRGKKGGRVTRTRRIPRINIPRTNGDEQHAVLLIQSVILCYHHVDSRLADGVRRRHVEFELIVEFEVCHAGGEG